MYTILGSTYFSKKIFIFTLQEIISGSLITLSIPWLIYQYNRKELSESPGKVYSYIFELIYLLNLDIFSINLYQKIFDKINHSYSNEDSQNRKYGFLTNFYSILSFVNIINFNDKKKEEIYRRVMLLYNPEGGFGLLEGYAPRLKQTYYALKVIKKLNFFHMIDKKNIHNWVIATQNQDYGHFTTPLVKKPCIEETYYAIQILKLLESPIPDFDKCEKWLVIKWKSMPNIENSFYLINCVSMKKEYTHQIINRCLRIYYDKFNNMRYDKDIREIYMYLYIAKCCYGTDSIEFEQLTRNVKKEIEKIVLI